MKTLILGSPIDSYQDLVNAATDSLRKFPLYGTVITPFSGPLFNHVFKFCGENDITIEPIHDGQYAEMKMVNMADNAIVIWDDVNLPVGRMIESLKMRGVPIYVHHAVAQVALRHSGSTAFQDAMGQMDEAIRQQIREAALPQAQGTTGTFIPASDYNAEMAHHAEQLRQQLQTGRVRLHNTPEIQITDWASEGPSPLTREQLARFTQGPIHGATIAGAVEETIGGIIQSTEEPAESQF